MGAYWKAILVNDRRMLNNEILKKNKNFRFPVKKLIRNIFWEKRVWNFKHCQYIYLIDNIVTDHNKKNILSKPKSLELGQNSFYLNICSYQNNTGTLS